MNVIWHNGRFIPAEQSSILPADRGFLLGDGVFDTMAAQDGMPVDAPAHQARLIRHAAVLGISLPAMDDWHDIVCELLARNRSTTGAAIIRTTLTRGPGGRGLALPEKETSPTLLITAELFDPESYTPPATAIIAQTVRRNEGSPLSRIKSLNYGDNVLAQREAQEAGADIALMTNNAGYVCGAANGNLFIAENGRLYTPPLSDGVLDGIVRARIMTQHAVSEESLSPARLFKADALWVTNSLIGVRPVAAVDGRAFPVKMLSCA